MKEMNEKPPKAVERVIESLLATREEAAIAEAVVMPESGVHDHPHEADGKHPHHFDDGKSAGVVVSGAHVHDGINVGGLHRHDAAHPFEGAHPDHGDGAHDHLLAKGLHDYIDFVVDAHHPSHKWLKGHKRTLIRHRSEAQLREATREDWVEHTLWSMHSTGKASVAPHAAVFVSDSKLIEKVYEFEDGSSRAATLADFEAEFAWFEENTPSELRKRLAETEVREAVPSSKYWKVSSGKWVAVDDDERKAAGKIEGKPRWAAAFADGSAVVFPKLMGRDAHKKAHEMLPKRGAFAIAKETQNGVFKTMMVVREAAPPHCLTREQAAAKKKLPPTEYSDGFYRLQTHFRGASAHKDLRIKLDGKLGGWTITDQPIGAIKDDPDTVEQAYSRQQSVKWRFRPDMDSSKPVFAIVKAEHPLKWLNAHDTVFEPGTVGASAEEEGIITLCDEGMIELGMQKPKFREYFFDGDVFKSRVVFRIVDSARFGRRRESCEWEFIPDGASTDDFVETRLREVTDETRKLIKEQSGEEPRSAARWQVATNLVNETPTILSSRERRKPRSEQYVPQSNERAVPSAIAARVPKELAWWADGLSAEQRLSRLDRAFDRLIEDGIIVARKLGKGALATAIESDERKAKKKKAAAKKTSRH